MKATKFLFVMAMAAGLAACTKELVEPGKPVDSIEEVKGAKVIANGFSINPNASDIQTKIAIGDDGKATWTPGDVAGVAWFTDGNVGETQSGVLVTDLKPKAYANHKLEYKDGRFESNSNVFEGWHVAYRPYNEMKRPAEITGITVNPVLNYNLNVDDNYMLDAYENAPYFSGAHFISEKDVENGHVSTDMNMSFIASELLIDLHANDFGPSLDGLKITSIKLSSNAKKNPLFLNKLSVNPNCLPAGKEKEYPTFTADHFGSDKAFYGDYSRELITEIAEDIQEDYTLEKLSEGKVLTTRMFVAPVAVVDDLAISDYTLTVSLDNGNTFVVKPNTKDKTSLTYQKGFARLHALLTKDGWTPEGSEKAYSLRTVENSPIRLHFELTGDNYINEYLVSNEGDVVENMYKTIKLAREAGATSIALKFEGGAEIPYDGDKLEEALGEMIINCSSKKGVTTFVISDKQTWNSNIVLGTNMNVEVTGDLTIAENTKVTTKTATFPVANLTNAGIVNVGEDVDITAKYITNTTDAAVINVSKGSKFTLSGTDAVMPGNVVYTVVDGTTTEDIDNLIKNTNLTTLIVEKDWTGLNKNAAWGPVKNGYTGLTVKMNASKVTADGITITVKAWEITGNGNEITCKTLAAKGQSIVIPAGADAKINADVTGAVVAYGTLKVGNVSSTLTVADDVKVEAGSVKGAATIGAGAKVKAAGFAGGVKIGADANVTVTGAIAKVLTIDEGAVVDVTGNVTGDIKTPKPIVVAAGATLNVVGNVSNTAGVNIGASATVTVTGDVESNLTIAETPENAEKTTEVTIEGDVTGAVTVGKGSKLTVNGSITGAVTVAETATLDVKGATVGDVVMGVSGALKIEENAVVTVTGNIAGAVTVNKNAEVTVDGDIAGDVTATDATSIVVKGIKAKKVNVDAKSFVVTSGIEITEPATGTPEIVIGKNTTFELTGDITGPSVDLAVYGTAVLKNTNMRHKLRNTLRVEIGANVTIDTFDMTAPKLQFGDIYNQGILNVVGPKYVYVYNLNMEGSRTTSVDATLYYYETVTLGGSTSGTIKKADEPDSAKGYEVIGDTYYVNAPNGLAEAIKYATEETINVVLETAVKLDAADFGTKNIVIDANKNEITFIKPTEARHPISAKSIQINNATIIGQTEGCDYYEHSLVFDCPVVMNDVTTKNAILLQYAGAEKCEFNNVVFEDKTLNTDPDNLGKGYYALWIEPYGQTVNVTGCTFNMTAGEKGKGGRGIKIEEKNSKSAPIAGVSLTVKNTTFKTQAKAAVTVHCGSEEKSVNITWENNTINDVAEAPKCPVWIDECIKDYAWEKANLYTNALVVNGEQYPTSTLIAVEK